MKLKALLAFIVLFSTSYEVFGKNIVVLGAFDTDDRRVGAGIKVDFKNSATSFDELKKYTQAGKYSYTRQFVSGKSFTEKHILKLIDNAPINSDTTVIFIASCHGFRALNDKSPFQRLLVPDNEYGLQLETIHQRIKNRGARLVVTLVDACNERANIVAPQVASVPSAVNIRKFFLEATGEIKLSSSSPGQYAYGPPLTGGYLVKHFLYFVDWTTNISDHFQGASDWDGACKQLQFDVLEETRKLMKPMGRTNADGTYGQKPVYRVNVSM